MRPPFAYYGGKATLARRIVPLLGRHRAYIEPFAGSLAVLFAKEPAPMEIVNDVDGDIVNFFHQLRDNLDNLEHVCALTPYARDELAGADLDDTSIDDLERARRFWVRVTQSFAKSHGKASGWSVSLARTQSAPRSALSKIGRFASVAERLSTVAIENYDAVDLIARFGHHSGTVIYADPPYLAEGTDRNARYSVPDDYRHDMGDAASHRRLADALHDTAATVILSGYPSPLYDDLYAGWHRLDIPVTVQSSNATRNARAARTEVMWSNQPFPDDRQLRLLPAS